MNTYTFTHKPLPMAEFVTRGGWKAVFKEGREDGVLVFTVLGWTSTGFLYDMNGRYKGCTNPAICTGHNEMMDITGVWSTLWRGGHIIDNL